MSDQKESRSSSIRGRLSEFTASIVAENLSDRLNSEKRVKRIYDWRSAIVHGRKQTVPPSIVSESMNLMKEIITKIITNPELIKLQSIEQVEEWVNKKKYS
ncbi:hypothetical protein [Leptothoe sp. PORK10 BA2]|uniref:hypothetical protein n=1 Tax=Leptothoe sp. PORK10 BA2 TaxID=3110254 RepID=UPI002B20C56A|nr:hypothetical protein [Leptothoe sp. PORK10 BA2]MEA5464528.1 hypothetical protein [Leptothoe sp. PORK10 BA2]